MPDLFPIQERFGRVEAYLLDDGNGLTLIDSLGNRYAEPVLAELSRLGRDASEVKRIILTHGHLTHVKGAATLKRLTGATVYGPIEERDVIEGRAPSNQTTWIPRRPFRVLLQQYLLNLSNVLWRVGLRLEPLTHPAVVIDQLVEHDDQQIGPLHVIRTPGHSPGSTSFYWPETETLFAGDAIVTWPRFELGWKGLTEDFGLNVKSIEKLVKTFDEQGWRIRRFATGHGDVRETLDGIADLKRLLKA